MKQGCSAMATKNRCLVISIALFVTSWARRTDVPLALIIQDVCPIIHQLYGHQRTCFTCVSTTENYPPHRDLPRVQLLGD